MHFNKVISVTENKIRVLVVDDEPLNLDLIKNYVENYDYDLTFANGGQEALDLLLASNESQYDIILLDRMMPDISGMKVLQVIKNNDILKNVPVIMQTARANTTEVAEGIRAGAFYYLTKPFDGEMLRSIMSAAAQDARQRQIDQRELEESRLTFGALESFKLNLKELDEVNKIAIFISQLYPEPETVLFGIKELLINAIEHGNLGIGYDLKTDLLRKGEWKNEIEKRNSLPENTDKKVSVSYLVSGDEIILHIKDNGNGFNWNEYLEVSPTRATDNHGRGIAISLLMSFDFIEYIGSGNEVVCTVNIEKSEQLLDVGISNSSAYRTA